MDLHLAQPDPFAQKDTVCYPPYCSYFLQRLLIFCSNNNPFHLRLVSDNLGLLTHCEQRMAQATLDSEWDVIEQITLILRSMPASTTFTHVLGHQDDHTAYEDLSLEARLNVDADAEAGLYITHNPSPLSATLSPTAPCKLSPTGHRQQDHHRTLSHPHPLRSVNRLDTPLPSIQTPLHSRGIRPHR
jgi:hypothetical protein